MEYSLVGVVGHQAEERDHALLHVPLNATATQNTGLHSGSVSAPLALSHLELCIFFCVLCFQHWGGPTSSTVVVLGPSLQDKPRGTGELWKIAHPLVWAQSCCEVGEN